MKQTKHSGGHFPYLGPFGVILVACSLTFSCGSSGRLKVVGEFVGKRPSKIAVSLEGRIFISQNSAPEDAHVSEDRSRNYGGGSGDALVEFKAGGLYPYPDGEFQAKEAMNVAGMAFDNTASLWVLDGNKKTLYQFDLQENRFENEIVIGDDLLTPTSSLEDILLDKERGIAYLVDGSYREKQSVPIFLRIDLQTGEGSRLLEQSTETQSQEAQSQIGQPPKGASATLSVDGRWIFFREIQKNGRDLFFRGPTEAFGDWLLTDKEIVETFRYVSHDVPPSGQVAVDKRGNLYAVDDKERAIVCINASGIRRTLFRSDEFLQQVATLSISGDDLYVVSERPSLGSNLYGDKVYRLLKIKLVP